MTARRRRYIIEIALVALVIAAAVWRRAEYLDIGPFWVDEAESSINALTILQNGYPGDRYLGIPIYENTLVKGWPGNAEYEFKDSSYSDRGFATYHGWLPLYSIAASFALNGIAPDQAGHPPALRGVETLKRRSRIARLPSVLYGAIFLALCYVGGILVFGRDAGITALLVGCVHQTHIDLCIRARYYSATVALSTLALLAIWLMLTKGRWRDYLVGACAFIALFFTHLVTFAAAAGVLAVLAPVILWKQPGALRKLSVFALLLFITAVPWIWTTGFLSGLGSIPPARSLLSFPADLLRYPPARPIYFVFFGAFAALVAFLMASRSRLPQRIEAPLRQCLPAVALLSLWVVAGYLAFILLMPAASFFPERLDLSYWGPALLLAGVFCAAGARAILPRYSLAAAPAIAFLLLWVSGHPLRATPSPQTGSSWESLVKLTKQLDIDKLPSATRLYAAPNQHLILSFYSGLPFQSIAPIRKSFLDSYPGPVVYVESASFLPAIGWLAPALLQQTAKGHKVTLTDKEATDLSRLLRTADYRTALNRDVLGSHCSLESLPSFSRGNLAKAQALQVQGADKTSLELPVFRGFNIQNGNPWTWRTVFFYRFVDPISRSGRNLNFAGRLRGSYADILTGAGWVIYRSPAGIDQRKGSTHFRLLP